MTKIKICGITNLDDALFAASQGADALGFNFYGKSPRYISPEKAAGIISKLPGGVSRVGVFVNETLENILDIARVSGISVIQLHGDESPPFVKELKDAARLWIIKAIRVSPDFAPEDVLKYKADAILLDAFSKNEYGGTGEGFNWDMARQAQEIFPKIYLAGGLSAANVEEAVSTVKPYGVDACSLLESAKGKKDENAVSLFIANALRPGTRASEEMAHFIKTRMEFLITGYGFSIAEETVKPDWASVSYRSDKVEITAHYFPARAEYGVSFGLISQETYRFDIEDLVETLQLEIPFPPPDREFGVFPQTKAAQVTIGRGAEVLEKSGGPVLRGDRDLYARLHRDRDNRSTLYNQRLKYDRLRRDADSAWRRHDYAIVAKNYSEMKEGLSPAERKKLEYSMKQIGRA
jgi:phosphoribosylanthranilate isomerase